jgi:hypothetical protein
VSSATRKKKKEKEKRKKEEETQHRTKHITDLSNDESLLVIPAQKPRLPPFRCWHA